MERSEGKIVLGDGKEYTVRSYTIGDFIEIEKKYGSLKLEQDKMEPTIFWFWLAIRKAHKDMTLENLYDLIDMKFINNGGLQKITDAMTSVNDWQTETDSKNPLSPTKE